MEDKMNEDFENRKSFLLEDDDENINITAEDLEEDIQAKEDNEEEMYSTFLVDTVQKLKEYCMENGLPLCEKLNPHILDTFIEKSLDTNL